MNEEMEAKSKTLVKREMLALQSLGEQLLSLSADQIKKIEMPPELLDAVLSAKTIKKGEARRRQLQYIGSLMREVDPKPIRKILDDILSGHAQETGNFKQIERWRDELVEGNDAVMNEIVRRFPAADRRTLCRLVLNARKDREENRNTKESRALFRFLREL